MDPMGKPLTHARLGDLAGGTCVKVWRTDGSTVLGMVDHADTRREELVVAWPDIHPAACAAQDTDSIVIPFPDIVAMRHFPDATVAVLEAQLGEIPAGTRLAIRKRPGDTSEPTIKQGILDSIDWDARTLVLRDTALGHALTVSFERMLSIDIVQWPLR